MEAAKLLTSSNVCQRVKKCLFSKDGSRKYVRSMIMGTLFVSFFIQIGVFREIRRATELGQLPWYTTDLTILFLGIMEVCFAACLGAVFRGRRRDFIMAAMLQLDVLALVMLAATMDDVPEGNEFCNGGGAFEPTGLTTKVALKLAALFVVLASGSLAGMTAWSHGIAYMYEVKKDGMILHYGVLIIVRVFGLVALSRLLSDMPIWLLTIAVCGQLTVHIIQMLKVPVQPIGGDSSVVFNGFMNSLGRVLANRMALSLMLSMGFVVAAFWGLAWYDKDIVKAKYLMEYKDHWMDKNRDLFLLFFIVLAINMAATKFKPPLMPEFSMVSAAKLTTISTLIIVPLYFALLVLFRCNHGSIAGTIGKVYRQPSCSLTCGCREPFDSFSPVCAVQSMTTYLSPCHAGCNNTEIINGLTALSNCKCAGASGWALRGPCAMAGCSMAFEIHRLFFLFQIIGTIITLQVQGVMVLLSVEKRDASIAIGVTSAVVAFVTFVCGHTAFIIGSVKTCAWFQGGRCQLQNYLFPYVMAGLCGGFAFGAFLINLVILCVVKRRQKKEKDDIDLSTIE